MDRFKELLPKLQQQLFQIRSEKHLELAQSMEQFNKMLLRVYLYFGLQTYIFFSAVPFLKPEKSILTKAWFPFDWTVSPYYEIVYVFQNAVSFWNVMVCLNMDALFNGLLIFIGLQCDFLCLTLNDMGVFKSEDGDVKKIDVEKGCFFIEVKNRARFSRKMCQKLIVCIEHYNEIKK